MCAHFLSDVAGRYPLSPSSDSPEPHVVFLGVLVGAFAVVILLAVVIAILHVRATRALKTMMRQEEEEDVVKIPGPNPQYYESVRQGDEEYYRQQRGCGHHQLFVDNRPPSQLSVPLMPPPQLPPPIPLNPPGPLPSTAIRAGAIGQSMEAGLMSDAESRVNDWVQLQQKSNPEAVMQMLEVDRLRLKLGQLLQEGTFGRVYQSTLLNDDDQEEDVLVKTVVAGSSHTQSQVLIRDGTSLQGMVHHHVLTLLASTWDGTSPMLVYPYPCHGNLKKWLQANSQTGLSTHLVVSLGLQMLKAMQHLHKRKIVHRDVAARNCL